MLWLSLQRIVQARRARACTKDVSITSEYSQVLPSWVDVLLSLLPRQHEVVDRAGVICHYVDEALGIFGGPVIKPLTELLLLRFLENLNLLSLKLRKI